MARKLMGLSPPMRGNLLFAFSSGVSWGSIPAHAGKPLSKRFSEVTPRVYPRPCGETTLGWKCGIQWRGLSPPMRGNPARVSSPNDLCGSIPAHAGKPRSRCTTPRVSGVYPRPCGETIDKIHADVIDRGLFPPMRGNLSIRATDQLHGGSIPAHAGKPQWLHALRCPTRVYPRPCGETRADNVFHSHGWGLSPPMRGNPHRYRILGSCEGLSPPMRGNRR